eukprot:2541788-Alexandrium_andersonii.AAC.2
MAGRKRGWATRAPEREVGAWPSRKVLRSTGGRACARSRGIGSPTERQTRWTKGFRSGAGTLKRADTRYSVATAPSRETNRKRKFVPSRSWI